MFTILGTDGKEYGPVSAATVKDWMADGRATPDTQARRRGEAGWRPLGDFPEFGGKPTAPAFAAPPPAEESPPFAPLTPETAMPEANRWLRLGAAAIDGLLQFLCWLPATFAALQIVMRLMKEQGAVRPEQSMQAILDSLPLSLPYLGALVLVQATLLCLRSQSVGKLLVGLRILRVSDGQPGGPARAFFIRGCLIWTVEQVPLFGKLFWLADVLFIFRKDQRCLHDLLAGTQVVKI